MKVKKKKKKSKKVWAGEIKALEMCDIFCSDQWASNKQEIHGTLKAAPADINSDMTAVIPINLRVTVCNVIYNILRGEKQTDMHVQHRH